MNIWKECNGKDHISSLSETAWRIVESQEISSTRNLGTGQVGYSANKKEVIVGISIS